ncbi:MAG: MaoC family dehydratase [Caulobacterales bacterium]|jgi:acyl dehydratase
MGVIGQSWYFDDIPLGYTHVFGAAPVTADDIAVFKDRFAPHLPLGSETHAETAPLASQAHIYALWSRMLWDETQSWPVLARLGQDALRWYRTAKAGDTLSMRVTFVSKQPVSESRGILIASHELLNQEGELVMALMTRTVMARHPGAAAA